jgi:hypothetical protein
MNSQTIIYLKYPLLENLVVFSQQVIQQPSAGSAAERESGLKVPHVAVPTERQAQGSWSIHAGASLSGLLPKLGSVRFQF